MFETPSDDKWLVTGVSLDVPEGHRDMKLPKGIGAVDWTVA